MPYCSCKITTSDKIMVLETWSFPLSVVTQVRFGYYLFSTWCACLIHTHPSSTVSDTWTHPYSSFWGRSSLCPSWDAWCPCQGLLLAYLCQVRWPVSWSWLLVKIYCCRSPQGTAPDPSLSWITCTRLLSQGQIYNLLGHCTDPWSWSWIISL